LAGWSCSASKSGWDYPVKSSSGSLRVKCGTAAAILGLAVAKCYAFGGWDYAHPHEEMFHAIRITIDDSLPFLFLYVLIMAGTWTVMKAATGRRGFLSAFACVVFVAAFYFFARDFGVEGAPGPAHLAFFICCKLLLGLLTLGIARIVWMALRLTWTKPRWLRFIGYGFLVAEITLVGVAFASPILLTGPTITSDGAWICSSKMHGVPGSFVQEFRESTGRNPTSFAQVTKFLTDGMYNPFLTEGIHDPSIVASVGKQFQCPVCGKWYVLETDRKTGKLMISCPFHGLREVLYYPVVTPQK
jgi:hypothetical protein